MESKCLKNKRVFYLGTIWFELLIKRHASFCKFYKAVLHLTNISLNIFKV